MLFSNILQFPFNNLLALFGYRKVVLLGDFAAGVDHLVAEQVGGRVLLGEAGAVGMAQVVVLEGGPAQGQRKGDRYGAALYHLGRPA